MKHIMNYEEAHKFIKYTETFGSRLGLATIEELLRRLNNPQNQRPVVHIAGTNGKGSVFAFLESGLRAGGYRVGRYISPTLFTYMERFQINGEYMEKGQFTRYVGQIAEVCSAMVSDGFLHPTVFEVETAIAFLYFAEEMVDVVLLETGMGGREDATNVVERPLATVFSSISRDHMELLGNTLAGIAMHKSGIMRKKVPVILAPMESECRNVLLQQAEKLECEVTEVTEPKAQYAIEGTRFVYENREYTIPLLGTFQPGNAACAIATWQAIRTEFPMEEETFAKGMANTVWKGRFEVLSTKPYVIRDGAHNLDAVRCLKETLKTYFPNNRIHFVIGIFKDKEYQKMIAEIAPMAASIYTVTPPNSKRALQASVLKQEIEKVLHLKHQEGDKKMTVEAVESVEQALKQAIAGSRKEDVVILFGSLSLARFL